MANTYQIIEENTWERAMHCAVFRNSVEPAFCVTFEADITDFKRMVKKEGVSFTLAMVYAVCKCANRIEAFRYRFLDGQAVLYDRIDTAFTYLNKDTGLFKVVNVPMVEDLKEYCALAAKTAEEQKEYFTGPLGNDVFQCSAMPWVTYTHISHTNAGKKDNATPLFDWGKYYEKEGKVLIPISVQAHHSFVDGLHIGQFAEELQSFFEGMGNFGITEREARKEGGAEMEYRINDKTLRADIFLSFVNQIWKGDYDEQKTEEALAKTLNITAYDNQILVGCLRILTDGYFFGTITELLVLPDHQGKGIGSRLLSLAKEHTPTLLYFGAQPGVEEFYEKNGCVKSLQAYMIEKK